MKKADQPLIKDLAVIGDKRTCALIDKQGSVAWHCLWRFDQPSLFSLLINQEGGYWGIDAPGKRFLARNYQKDSAILVSEFAVEGGSFAVTDFMPLSEAVHGICRIFSASPVVVTVTLLLTPDYGRSQARLSLSNGGRTASCQKFEFYVKASHPMELAGNLLHMTLPAHEKGWMVLVDDERDVAAISAQSLEQARLQTLGQWQAIMQNIDYEGPYREQVYQSYKAIQLVTHAFSGGILAAGTTSLPEVISGSRNYDYRYVWLRDTAMVVSALVRAGSKGNEAERFLDFLCTSKNTNKKNLFVPFYDLDAKTAPDETFIPGSGYQGSTPLRIGNGAFEQLQLDGQGNVLLAAKQIYGKNHQKPHWLTVVDTAEYLVKNWHNKDHGIWEEGLEEHFTSSKVLVAKSLEFIAEYAESEKQRNRWCKAAKEIRTFVQDHCLTSDGAYAVFAGSEEVDITAALYPVWWFDDAQSPAMLKTIARIEAEYKEGALYHRRLEETDSSKEGVFLAASLWMAQYYVAAHQLNQAKTIIDAVLEFSTDLGFLPEEGDVTTGALLGNIPQTFVHSSLIGVILDYNKGVDAAVEP